MSTKGLAVYGGDKEVEEIMRLIKEDLVRRRGGAGEPELNITEDRIRYISSNWDVHNNSYVISSHRPVIGRALVRGRGLVHGEVKRYVDPVISRQSQLNHTAASLLRENAERQEEMAAKLERLEELIDDRIGRLKTDIDRDLLQVRSELEDEIEKGIEDRVRGAVAAVSSEIDKKAWLANLLSRRIERDLDKVSPSKDKTNYFVFEERFRGSREEIKKRQSLFVQFFERCHNVLDIGCGRGEFLELLSAQGIGVKGIDIDEDMVNYCASKGLSVEKMDAISYLEKTDDKSLDGIFLDQVVEHLEPDYLLKMLSLCYQKMIYGSYLVVETVNPLSLYSFANFYMDMTHKRPIHPETLKFLLEASGLREVETRFVSPVPDGMRLRKIVALEDEHNAIAEIHNYNIDKLNNILFGPQDYFALGKK